MAEEEPENGMKPSDEQQEGIYATDEQEFADGEAHQERDETIDDTRPSDEQRSAARRGIRRRGDGSSPAFAGQPISSDVCDGDARRLS